MKRLLSSLLLLLAFCAEIIAINAPGDTVTVNNAFMFELGSAHRADTYLTPLHYSGWTGKLAYGHAHSFRNRSLFWELDVNLQLDRTMNKVRNSRMFGAQFLARWSAVKTWNIVENLSLGAGAATTLDAGALYLSRNGNNPVAANASWTIDASAYASYRFKIGKLPVTAIYRADLPVVGAMFAPDYGQLYYEIYLGDSKNIFSGAWWGRYFRLDQSATLDIKVNSKYLRLGYGCNIISTKVNHIISRRIDHTFIIGITTDWLTH